MQARATRSLRNWSHLQAADKRARCQAHAPDEAAKEQPPREPQAGGQAGVWRDGRHGHVGDHSFCRTKNTEEPHVDIGEHINV